MFLGVPKSIVVRLGWMTMSYGTVLVLRLLNNVILTRILAPPIFGLMAVVNAIRTGVELLSDRFDVDVELNISADQLCDRISDYDALIVRSKTRVDAGVLGCATRLKPP